MGPKDVKEKHPLFLDLDDDVHTSGSDGDYPRAVEVSFDPTSPYRRKASLVSSEAVAHLPPSRKTECMVHQFLDSQRMADRSVDGAGNESGNHLFYGHPAYHFPHKQEDAKDISRQQGLENQIDGKGPSRNARADILALGTATPEEGDIGQADEKEWRMQICRTESQLDVEQPRQEPGDKSGNEELNSRLLTKRQLSEMAWGVRELSRRLSTMRIKFRVKSIFILTKIHDMELVSHTRELAKWLLGPEHDVRYVVYLEDRFRDSKRFNAPGLVQELEQEYTKAGELDEKDTAQAISKRLRYWDECMCRTRPHTFDFVITLGGDGTVLYASWLFQRIVPPVLSFSLGSLGFLTKFDFTDYQPILSNAFEKGVTVSLRLRFEGAIMRSQKRPSSVDAESSSSSQDDENMQRDLVEELVGLDRDDEYTHKPDGTYVILNEIVVDRGPNPTMSNTEIFGDDEHFTTIQADGVCVSTPTGSTAYNLAAGGSLCHPENPVMLVTSICAHTLSFRPIILPDTIVLRVGVPYQARTSSWASFDGRERIELRPGDYVTISASRFPFASVQSQGRRSEDWVNSIRAKLGWNTRGKQKGFHKWH
ncbi:ATP-NAD kinase [Sodiomyces alkalinus F11]|uniref:ATP-NAD kinase n=1 Tax=Sodiomyces alkalinus (strain CBS 110278 / VKM F-3762 / F11) TaxID=1314773 RepID=A0A3N2Q8S0_SODAK|nr:ATP-NAD kinase [Sodiomyces alkalinus F11]ROT43179.1 ATP-NAD kinase [Sodiomyces alkalinus F11]